ncbi:MAG TPA: phage baseplate assembly protein [Methylophilaceae bacterium]|nr:phage baseplate assembly protein [Methylophilaceae bacterium]
MSERLIAKMLSPLVRSIQNLALRATVTLVNSANKMQALQLTLRGGEAKDGIEHFEAYGLTSCPHPGAEGITLFFNGDRSHGVTVVVADRRYRLQGLQTGEVALYDDLGQKVHLKREGILIDTPFDIEMRGANVRIHGTESLIIECNGHGEKWLPDRKNTYTDNAVAGSHNNISVPEIPG